VPCNAHQSAPPPLAFSTAQPPGEPTPPLAPRSSTRTEDGPLASNRREGGQADANPAPSTAGLPLRACGRWAAGLPSPAPASMSLLPHTKIHESTTAIKVRVWGPTACTHGGANGVQDTPHPGRLTSPGKLLVVPSTKKMVRTVCLQWVSLSRLLRSTHASAPPPALLRDNHSLDNAVEFGRGTGCPGGWPRVVGRRTRALGEGVGGVGGVAGAA
jgi:hypothetical protein